MWVYNVVTLGSCHLVNFLVSLVGGGRVGIATPRALPWATRLLWEAALCAAQGSPSRQQCLPPAQAAR